LLFYTTSFLALPILLLIWAIDFYLILVAAQLLLSGLRARWAAPLASQLQPIVDRIPNVLGRLLARRRDSCPPSWLPWLIVLSLAFVLRHLCLLFILKFLCTKGASS